MMIQGKIEGLDQLAANSRKLSKHFERGTMRTALRNAAKPVRTRARELAPAEEGILRKQIKSKAKVLRNGYGYADVSWTTDAWYGGFVELGTDQLSARPFLEPALEEAHEDGSAEAAFIESINKTIAKALKKIG